MKASGGLSRVALAIALMLVMWCVGVGSAQAQTAVASGDFDGDGVVNSVDPDDDGDGLPDIVDPFALDPSNGLKTPLPLSLTFDPVGDPARSFLGVGFTGLMSNGTDDPLALYDAAGVTVAGGALTVNAVDQGDAYYTFNNQHNGFQVGIPVRPGGPAVTVRTRILAPFAGLTPADFQSMGLFVGTGDQDNYVKLTTASIGEPSVQLLKEESRTTTTSRTPLAMPGPAYVDLYLRVDPTALTIQGSYVASVNGTETARTAVSEPLPIPATWLTAADRGLAIGLISTSLGAASPFPASWDLLEAVPDPAGAPAPAAPVAPSGGDITAPKVTHIKVSPTRFATVKVGKRRAGATVRFRLSEAANVQVTVVRRLSGRRSGTRCVAPTAANRSAKRCTREVTVAGSVSAALKAGSRRVRFTGRLNGKRLKKGSYRLIVSATDAAGNATMSRGPIFRVTR